MSTINISSQFPLFWENVSVNKRPLVIWGAGERGDFFLSLCILAGIKPVCFGDNNGAKNGVFFKGVPILDLKTINESYPEYIILIAAHKNKESEIISYLSSGVIDKNRVTIFCFADNESAIHSKFFAYSKREKLKNKNFTIIGNSCTPYDLYKFCSLEPKTPTDRIIIYPEHFVRMVERMEYYMSQPFVFKGNYLLVRDEYRIVYPVGSVGDVDIHFVHDHSFESARQTWENGVEQICWNNLFFIFDDIHFPLSKGIAERFNRVPYDNAILLTPYDYSEFSCVCRYDVKKLWPGAALNTNVLIRYDKFDFVRWLNSGGRGKDYEVKNIMDDLPEEYVQWLNRGGMSFNMSLNDNMMLPARAGGGLRSIPWTNW